MYRKKTEPWAAVDSVPSPQSPGVRRDGIAERNNEKDMEAE
jgi:hypothetical protein